MSNSESFDGQGKAPVRDPVYSGVPGEAGPSGQTTMEELFGSSDSDDDQPRGVASAAASSGAGNG